MPWKPVARRTDANKRQSHQKTTTQRGYGWKHQQHAKRLKKERPLCEDCLEKDIVTPSVEKHHIAKVRERPDIANDDENARMLCVDCHKVRTARGE